MIESQTTEFKRIWQDDYLKTICAFANAQGGSLWLGVDDSGDIVGLDEIETLLEVLPNKINNRLGLIVELRLHLQNNLNYLEIYVPATYAPVSLAGKFYQRSGSQKLMYDLYYIKNWSVWLEVETLVRTVGVVLGKKGI